MRPRSDTREALAGAADRLVAGMADTRAGVSRGVSFAAMAVHANVPADKAQRMVRDMARAGDLVPCGTEARNAAGRPAILYMPRHLQGRAARGITAVMHSWATASTCPSPTER